MAGYLYKDWRLNRWYFLAGIGFSVFFFIFMYSVVFPVEMEWDRIHMSTEEYLSWYMQPATSMMMSISIFSAMIATFITDRLAKTDERKIWAGFAISAPGAAKGYITAKYCFCLLAALPVVVIPYFAETVLAAITKLPVDCSLLYLPMFYFVLLMFATAFPFSIRFGYKRGNHIRLIILLGILFLGFVYFLFGDLAIFNNADAFGEKLYNMMVGEEKSQTVSTVMAALPCISLAAFGISYVYSCKAYAKGVNHYDG